MRGRLDYAVAKLARARLLPRASPWCTSGSLNICYLLFQQLEVGDDLGRLVVSQADVGHQRAGLQSRWIQNPLLEIVGTGVVDRAAGNLGAARDAGQVGT